MGSMVQRLNYFERAKEKSWYQEIGPELDLGAKYKQVPQFVSMKTHQI